MWTVWKLLIILIIGNLSSIQTLETKRVEKVKKHLDEEEAGEIRIGSLAMEIPKYTHRTESETPRVQTPNTPDPVQHMVEAPLLEMDNQNYTPPRTPRSRREMQLTRAEPPLQGRKRE